MFDEMIAVDATQWQTTEPFDAIIFDCDGTLTAIEGIDELALYNNVAKEVEQLTIIAMEKGQMTESLYQQRLDLVKPTKSQIYQLATAYREHVVKNAQSVIDIFKSFGKKVYIISAGLTPSVVNLAEFLAIPESQVYAVDISFDNDDHYVDFDHSSPLITTHGKQNIIKQLKQTHENIFLTGDGMNDLNAKEYVDRFVGFGGVFVRESVRSQSQFYITSKDFAALLPLVLTYDEEQQLSLSSQELFQRGLKFINQQQTIIKET